MLLQDKMVNEKFYFNSFLIAFSAFFGAVLSLLLNFLWLSNKSTIERISYSIILLAGSIIFVLLVLYLVIYFIGSMAQKKS